MDLLFDRLGAAWRRRLRPTLHRAMQSLNQEDGRLIRLIFVDEVPIDLLVELGDYKDAREVKRKVSLAMKRLRKALFDGAMEADDIVALLRLDDDSEYKPMNIRSKRPVPDERGLAQSLPDGSGFPGKSTNESTPDNDPTLLSADDAETMRFLFDCLTWGLPKEIGRRLAGPRPLVLGNVPMRMVQPAPFGIAAKSRSGRKEASPQQATESIQSVIYQLLASFTDGDAYVRRAAAAALGQLGAAAATAATLDALVAAVHQDPDSSVRAASAAALGQLGAAAATAATQEALVDAIRQDPDPGVRAGSATALRLVNSASRGASAGWSRTPEGISVDVSIPADRVNDTHPSLWVAVLTRGHLAGQLAEPLPLLRGESNWLTRAVSIALPAETLLAPDLEVLFVLLADPGPWKAIPR